MTDLKIDLKALAKSPAADADIYKWALTESVPAHLLDSGCAYGYHYQRNRLIDFDAQSEVAIEIYQRFGEIEIQSTRWLYPALCNNYKIDRNITSLFHLWVEYMYEEVPRSTRPEFEGAIIYENSTHTAEIFMQHVYLFVENLIDDKDALHKKFAEIISGDLPDHENSELLIHVGGENSYNYESILSQGVQYELWEYDGDAILALAIHNGADIRGGYGSILFLRPNKYVEGDFPLLDASSYIRCECGKAAFCMEPYIYNEGIYSIDECVFVPDEEDIDPEDMGDYNGPGKLICPSCGTEIT